jgi:hypothetical protein
MQLQCDTLLVCADRESILFALSGYPELTLVSIHMEEICYEILVDGEVSSLNELSQEFREQGILMEVNGVGYLPMR